MASVTANIKSGTPLMIGAVWRLKLALSKCSDLTDAKFCATPDGAITVPFCVDVWATVSGSIFSKVMCDTIVGVGTCYQFQGIGIKVVDIVINFHNPALKFTGVSCVIPCVIPLNPPGTHKLVITKEEPMIFVVDPVVRTVISRSPLVLYPLRGAHKSCSK